MAVIVLAELFTGSGGGVADGSPEVGSTVIPANECFRKHHKLCTV